MKKSQVIRRPTRVADIDDFADDMYDSQVANRVERMRIRRWRAVKRQTA